MSWLLIVGLILQLIGPVLAEWLRDLFTKAAVRMGDSHWPGPNVMSAEQGMKALFKEAWAQLGYFEWHKSAFLRILEVVCVRRAEDIWRSGRENLPAPTMSAADVRDLAGSL